MSDLDTYLTELRSHLRELDQKRADEIIAEARTHLASRTAQFEATGISHDEAVAEATRTFGDPSEVAQDLVRGNARHRRPVALRAVAAFVIAFGSALAVTGLFSSPVYVRLFVAGAVTPLTGLDLVSTTRIVHPLAYCCIALVTGIVGGPRFWWIAALPGLVTMGWALLALSLLPPTVRAESGISLVETLVWGVAFMVIVASLGFLGSRLPRRRLSIAITIVCGSVVGLIWVIALMLAVAAVRKTDADVSVWYYGVLIATVMPVIVALLIAGRRDRFLSREAFIAALSGICGLGLVCAVALAVMLSDALHSTLRSALLPLTLAGLVCVAGLFSILVYTVRTRSTAGSSPPPADSE